MKLNYPAMLSFTVVAACSAPQTPWDSDRSEATKVETQHLMQGKWKMDGQPISIAFLKDDRVYEICVQGAAGGLDVCNTEFVVYRDNYVVWLLNFRDSDIGRSITEETGMTGMPLVATDSAGNEMPEGAIDATPVASAKAIEGCINAPCIVLGTPNTRQFILRKR